MSESPLANLPAAKGRIISFYSYKGGTGRSMAAANIAWMLALSGNRVLVIDWDLEAPGIHRYFHPFLEDKELLESPGLLDMVENLAAHAATASAPLDTELVDIIDYIEPLEWPRGARSNISWKQFGERARIDLMPAGRQGPAYSRKLSTFNWIDFYERLGGKRLLEAARRQMREIYDYVLIDSRTGVSDTSGICTVEMPDTLVICFTLNEQSIRGAVAVAQSVREQRSQSGVAVPQPSATRPSPPLPPFRMFFVPTRVEITSEREKREIALDIAQRTFAPYLDHVVPQAQDRYWGAVQMAYFPYYAFEEIPAVFGDKPNELLSLTTAIREVARAITDEPDVGLPALAPEPAAAEEVRREILSWHLRPSLGSLTDAARRAQEIYERSNETQRKLMLRTLLRLVLIEPSGAATGRATPLRDLDGNLGGMARLLAFRGLLILREQRPTPTVAFADAALLQEWEPLRHAIEGDRPFLTWHTSLIAAAESWKQNARDESTLLRGRVLDEAVAWQRQRIEDLGSEECKFIQDSLTAAERVQGEAEAVQARVAELERTLAEERAERAPQEAPSAGMPTTAPEPAPQPAGFWIRVAANLFDGLWIGVVATAATIPFGGPETDTGCWIWLLLPLVLGIIVSIFGWAFFGATPGKGLIGLRVIGGKRRRGLGMRLASVRMCTVMVSVLTAGIGFLVIAFTPDKRGLHDQLAGTAVIWR